MLKAIIFDMDGLLIDSEPIWQEAESKAFGKVGLSLTPEQMRQTMGLREDEAVQYWYDRHPWKGVSREEVEADIENTVIALIKTKGKEMPGVRQAIGVCKGKGLPLAVASSSFFKVIDTVLTKLNIKQEFTVIHSAEQEPFGKPHPGVYITTAQKLGVAPEFCVAFEDSPNGVVSAKAARMKCIAVPDVHVKDDKRFLIADVTLNSLSELSKEHLA